MASRPSNTLAMKELGDICTLYQRDISLPALIASIIMTGQFIRLSLIGQCLLKAEKIIVFEEILERVRPWKQ